MDQRISILVCTSLAGRAAWIAHFETCGTVSVVGAASAQNAEHLRVAVTGGLWDVTFAFGPEEVGNLSPTSPFDVWSLDLQTDWLPRILKILQNDQRDWNRKLPHPCKVLVMSLDRTATTREILEFGRLGIGAVIYPGSEETLQQALVRLSAPAPAGKTALCLAGGGIEGLIYEVGVLRALDDMLPGQGILDFDIYCGISAGAIIASVLANRVPPVEITRAFMQDSTMMSGIKPWMLFDFATRDIKSRLASLIWDRGYDDGVLSILAGSVPNAFFMGDNIEKVLESFFSEQGRTNSFHQLEKELYVGATDQDTSEHVVFGGLGWRDVPISRAVHASMALIPFYAPQYVAGRWFIDGSFTRTSEMEIAIAKGATLIVIVDPLVPIRAQRSGTVRGRGGVYAGIQGLKALVNTRFLGGLPSLMTAHPEVDFLVFMPEEEDMLMMSGSPLRYRYRMEIERVAYAAARSRLRNDWSRVKPVLLRHGLNPRDPETPDLS